MRWVRHPTLTGDGEVSIATTNGAVSVPMVSGVLAWPDGVPLYPGFKDAIPPDELVQLEKERARAELARKAQELGLKVVDGGDDTTQDDSAPQQGLAARRPGRTKKAVD